MGFVPTGHRPIKSRHFYQAGDNVHSFVLCIANSRSYFHFQGHRFKVSGNCTVHISPTKRCRTIVRLHWKWSNNNMTLVNERQQITRRHVQNVVPLRVLHKFANLSSPLVISLTFVFIEMLDKLDMKPARPWMLAHLKIIWQFHAHPVHQKCRDFLGRDLSGTTFL